MTADSIAIVLAGSVLILAGIVIALIPASILPGADVESKFAGTASVRGIVAVGMVVLGVILLIVSQIGRTAPTATGPTANDPLPVSPADPGTTGAHRPEVTFLTPAANSRLRVGQDVVITGSVSGLGGDRLWFLTRSSTDSVHYYTVSDSATADADGPWIVHDHAVGRATDVGGTITYFAVAADTACDTALGRVAQDPAAAPLESLPPTCVRLTGLPFAAVD